MKLHFEPNLDFQHDAIEAVCDLFKGQETLADRLAYASHLRWLHTESAIFTREQYIS